jgi:hypothetical protein
MPDDRVPALPIARARRHVTSLRMAKLTVGITLLMPNSRDAPQRPAVPPPPRLPDPERPSAEDVLRGVPSQEEVVKGVPSPEEIIGAQQSVDELLGRDR